MSHCKTGASLGIECNKHTFAAADCSFTNNEQKSFCCLLWKGESYVLLLAFQPLCNSTMRWNCKYLENKRWWTTFQTICNHSFFLQESCNPFSFLKSNTFPFWSLAVIMIKMMLTMMTTKYDRQMILAMIRMATQIMRRAPAPLSDDEDVNNFEGDNNGLGFKWFGLVRRNIPLWRRSICNFLAPPGNF